MRNRRHSIALWLCAMSACEAPTAPLPSGAVPFDAPAVYSWWWGITEACSRTTRSLNSVSWYVVPGVGGFPGPDGRSVAGMWYAGSNRIVLAGEAQWDGDLDRHEMLHALLQAGGHSREHFVGRCAGEVVCAGQCLGDVRQSPSPEGAAAHALSSSLSISVDIVPFTPQSALYDGHFMMIISARNPRSEAVVIDLPPSGDAGPPGSFGYRIVGLGGSRQYDMRADVPEVTRFAPMETKRFIFDLRNRDGSSRYDLAPGTYRFEGRYGDTWAVSAPTIDILP